MKLKKRHLKLFITLVIMALGAAGFLASPAPKEVAQQATTHNPGLSEVTHAADGDTLVIKNGDTTEKVRLIGVDTPEKNDRRKPVQCFAEAASNFTKEKVKSQRVRLETDSQSSNRDRYGRLLRYVYLADGTLLNKAIIAEGYGFAMTGFPHGKMDEFRAAEQEAKFHQKGLWSSCTVSNTTGYPQTNPHP